MSQDIATRLKTARDLLEKLGRATENLAVEYPTVFEDAELCSFRLAFEHAHDEAVGRLAAPRLSISTIGTTSSGKSTIVNALVGRRIAPIDSGEISGGVLTLRHTNHRCLSVEETADAPWECGRWEEVSDEDAYSRMRDGVMRTYHQTRQLKSCIAPQIVCEGPLLPAAEVNLLGLPTEFGVEFIDLPGLKSVNDRANLAVIQARVAKSFSLVALDYLQTDEEHRRALLGELTRVVKYLQGRTDSMIFILNRVDQRGKDDEPIETRIASLRREIQTVLGLANEPDVIPFEARLIYRVQCAWGPVGIAGSPSTSRKQRVEHLRGLFEECASSLKRRGKEEPGLKAWIRSLEDVIDDGELPSDDDMRTLLSHAREWSGGRELWQRLRERVEESFAELVILPTLIEVLETHRALLDALREVSRIRQIDSEERLQIEREDLEAVQTRLHEEVCLTRERFRNQLTQVTEGLKTGDQAERHEATKKLGPGFESLLSAVNEVTGDLTVSLIVPVRDALKERRGTYDLEEELHAVLSPPAARDLSNAYDHFSRRIPDLQRGEGTLHLRVRRDDVEATKRLHETEKDALRLYREMRESMAARAEFKLQTQVKTIGEALVGLLEKQQQDIAEACLQELPDLSLNQAIESARHARGRTELPDLPNEFFELPKAAHQRQRTEDEVVGKRKEVVTYTTGTCFKDSKTRTVEQDVFEEVVYDELDLPDEDGMGRQWADGLKRGEDSLWETLRNWMIDALNESSASFSTAVETVLRLADRTLATQQELIKSEHDSTITLWKSIDQKIEQLETLHKRLRGSASSESP